MCVFQTWRVFEPYPYSLDYIYGIDISIRLASRSCGLFKFKCVTLHCTYVCVFFFTGNLSVESKFIELILFFYIGTDPEILKRWSRGVPESVGGVILLFCLTHLQEQKSVLSSADSNNILFCKKSLSDGSQRTYVAYFFARYFSDKFIKKCYVSLFYLKYYRNDNLWWPIVEYIPQ